MVDALGILSDLVQNLAFLLILPVLWLFLYLHAWLTPDAARATGFDRRAFWLLMPGSLVGSIAQLPFLGISHDVLAVNIGGGLFPLLLACYLIVQTFSPEGRTTLGVFLGFLALETAALLEVVLAPLSASAQLVFLLLLATVFPLGLWASTRTPIAEEWGRRSALLLALVSGVLVVTFLTTSTVPDVGIVSPFPLYLVAPFVAGAIATALAKPRFGVPAARSLALGYVTATFGVLVGADILRQPPLYQGGTPAFYAIGGAGLLDLLYLTGLVALAGAFLTARLGSGLEVSKQVSGRLGPMTPLTSLRWALRLSREGSPQDVIHESAGASRLAASQARLLLALPAPDATTSPWVGLPVPHWMAADAANLEAVDRFPPDDPDEARRAWLTARWLVGVAVASSSLRFGKLRDRSLAFLLDVIVVTVPAMFLWALIALLYPGSFTSLVSSPVFNAAAFGYAAWAFVYFVILDRTPVGTLGKRWFRLAVTDRSLGRPGFLSMLIREAPKLLPLTVVGIGGALIVALLVRFHEWTATTLNGSLLSLVAVPTLVGVLGAVVVTVGLCALASLTVISLTVERQRLGDILAGTWVVRATPAVPPGALGPPPGSG